MRTLVRSALSMGAAAALLAGCGGPQPLINAPGALSRDQSVARASAVSRPIGIPSSSYRLVYSFGSGADGHQPNSSLIDVNGTLYGTTYYGGKYNGGTVFSISTTGTEHVLYSFGHRKDGQHPDASLIAVNGMLYGTTIQGGTYNSGTFFSLSMTGTEHVLHNFSNYDADFPQASLIDVKGLLYSTSNAGGRYTIGTVFSVSTTGTVHVLYSFGRHSLDGAFPEAGLIDVNGTLYGTTLEGGRFQSKGTVFSIRTSGAEHVLHSFGHVPDGASPVASLIDVKGTLYGTTCWGGRYAVGTVFSVSTIGKEQRLHSFRNHGDGECPTASLINVNGTLYGTTSYGGAYGTYLGGTLFSVTTSGAEHVLHSFGKPYDGFNPTASLIDVKGTLYGTTSKGGTHGEGTIFALKP